MATVSAGAVLKGEKELVKMLRDLSGKGETELKREVKRTAISIKNHYKRNIKNNYITGQLDKSIDYNISTTGRNATIGSDLDSALFIEFGTKAHPITPKSPGGVLAFKVGGEQRFSKGHMHPGTKANPGLLKAWIEMMIGNRFADRLRKRFDRIK